MKYLITLSIALAQITGQAFATEIDFNTPGSLASKFNIMQTTDRSFYEVANGGLSGSRALGFPFAPRSQVIATTKEPVVTWGAGSSVTLAGYFKAHIADYQNKNRRSLALGLSSSNNIRPRPTTEPHSVFPNANTFFAGLYTRDFDLFNRTIEVDFQLSGSQPDKTYSLTNSPIKLKDGEWYFMEVRFVEKRSKLNVEMAVAHVDDQGELIEVLYKGDHGYGVTPVDFFYGDPVYGLLYTRDPQVSGILTVDNFRVE